MEITYIILSYWVIAICATYVIRHYNGKRKRSINPFDNHEDEKKRIKTHLQIWLLVPIAIPFFLIYLTIHSIYVVISKHRYRNRPRPLTKRLRKILKYFVLDENRRVVSIANYNYDHGANFTLDQVYGKGYEASLSDEVKEQLKEDSNKYCNSNKVTDRYKNSSKQMTERMNSLSKEEATRNYGSLSLIADNYIKFVISFNIKSKDNLNAFLLKLPDLSLDEDYVLDDFRPSEQMNSVLWLYARRRDLPRPSDADFKYRENNILHVFGINSNGCRVTRQIKIGNVTVFAYKKRIKPLEPFHYITLPFTEEAIWQAFLLSQTYRLTGMRWHGGYAARTFVLLDEDIVKVTEKVQEEVRRIWSPDLNVSVVLGDGCAVISHCWFDNWKGLVQMKWDVKYDALKKQVTGIEVKDEKVLVKYNCGILY